MVRSVLGALQLLCLLAIAILASVANALCLLAGFGDDDRRW